MEHKNPDRLAIAYIRSATQLQGAETNEKQKEACKQYAAAHNLQITSFIEETPKSGNSNDQNEFVSKITHLSKKDGAKYLLTSSLDRLSRNPLVVESYIEKFQKEGIECITVQ